MKKMSTKMLVSILFIFGMAGIVNAYAVSDDFNSYADGTALSATTNWYSGGSSPVVNGGKVSPADNITTMSGGPMQAANCVKWIELAVGDSLSLSMDFQAADDGTFNDDRLGMMNDFDSTTSDRIFGAQLEGHHIESYFNRYDSDDGDRIELAGGFNLTANAWYTFNVTITKLGDYQMLLDTSLTTLGGDLVGSGSLDTGTLDASEQPNWYYFTDDQTSDPLDGGLWPAFKNYNASTGAADNFSFEIIIADESKASNPDPKNNANNVLVDVGELSWMPGEFIEADGGTHDLFFGIDEANVTAATVDNPMGTMIYQDLDVNNIEIARLEYGTTYYWRVDEVNLPANEGTIVGQVWSFATEAEGIDLTFDNIVNVTADAPTLYYETQEPNMTCNGSGLDANDMHSTDVDNTMWLGLGAVPGDTWIQYEFDQIYKFHEMLVWNYNEPDPGQYFGAKEVNISYSEDGQVWKSLGDLVHLEPADGADGYAANNKIDLDGAIGKFIKIELYNCWYDMPGGGLSEVRFSVIPTRVTKPGPENEAEEVALETDLTWKPGRGVVSHTVYIGSDPNEVKAGNADIIADTDELMYSPVLALAKTYYWKVDEVNDNEEYPVWDGPVWSFSTIDSILIDGFEEGYGDADTNAVYATWKDGYNDPSTNGSMMGNINIPYLSETALSGDYSSPMSYDNSVADYSEVVAETANLPIATSDWSVGSPSTLTIWFMGDSNNIIGDSELYCKIGGKTATYSGSLEVLTRAKWYQWAIDLDALNVNLSNIPDITIGIKNVGSQAGSGEILLDDIMLTGIAPFNPVTIYIEAEDADSITSGMSVQDANEGFFGTGYIASDSSVTEDQTKVKEDGTLDGVATYTIEIPETGVYKIGFRDWVFIDVNDENFNSFWVKLSGSDVTVDANLADNMGWANNNEIAAGGWVWADVVDNANLGVGLNYTIGEAGTYTLQVAYREYRNRLDAIEIRKVGELKEE